MDKDDIKKIASIDTEGDKQKRELLKKLLENENMMTFGMKCPSDKIPEATSKEEIQKFHQTIEEIRRMKRNEK